MISPAKTWDAVKAQQRVSGAEGRTESFAEWHTHLRAAAGGDYHGLGWTRVDALHCGQHGCFHAASVVGDRGHAP
jgi:hypothetical protein